MYFKPAFFLRLVRLLSIFIVFLILADLLTFFFYPNTIFKSIFLATREQTPLTWVSVVILLFISLACANAYYKTKNKLWYFLTLCFVFFSIDDASYIHERFSAVVQQKVELLHIFPSYSWVIIYFPLLLFAFSAVYLLLYKNATKYKRLIFLSIFFIAFGFFLDLLDGFVGKSGSMVFCLNLSCNNTVLHLIRLTEEVFEVLGMGILCFVLIKKYCLIKN